MKNDLVALYRRQEAIAQLSQLSQLPQLSQPSQPSAAGTAPEVDADGSSASHNAMLPTIRQSARL